MRGLNRMPVEELADLHSQSSLQLAVIDNVLNTKSREASRDLLRSQEEVESLNTKLLAAEEEMKEVKAKCMDLEGNIESSEPMVKVKEEVQRLRETLHEQGVEMARLRVEEAKAVEKSSLLPPLQAKCQSLEGEVGKLKMYVTELERMKGEMITKVIPHVCKSLMDSEEAGVLLANCINSARVWERAIVLEELAASGQKVVLSEREDYNSEASYLFDSASEALANAQFPYVKEVSANPDASIEDLLSVTPKKVATL